MANLRRCLLGFAAALLASGPASAEPQLWLAPVDNLPRAFNGITGTPDYLELFQPNARWPTVAKHIKVFKIYTHFAQTASDDELRHIIGTLRGRGIALAAELGVLPATEACGTGVEGYTGNAVVPIAERIKRLGGELRYIAMDEPLWYGAHYNQKNACHSPLDAIVKQAGTTIRAVRDVFPDVEIGDIEPFPVAAERSWSDELLRWFDALARETGRPLAFFHADVLRHVSDWPRATQALANAVRQRRIPFGVIYTGTLAEQSDAAWAAKVADEIAQYESAGPAPDQVVFQSWMRFPTHVLPENSPTTLTGVVRDYLRTPTTLKATRKEQGLSILLVGSDGAPVPGAVLDVQSQATSGRGVVRIDGTVPDGAQTAVLALRINAECGGCKGAGTVQLGTARFTEEGASPVIPQGSGWNAPGPARPMNIAEGQAVVRNSMPFPVTPGRPFRSEIAVNIDPGLENAGYLAVIFLKDDRREALRAREPLQRTWSPPTRVRTNDEGVAVIQSAGVTADAQVRIRFGGDASHRGAETVTR